MIFIWQWGGGRGDCYLTNSPGVGGAGRALPSSASAGAHYQGVVPVMEPCIARRRRPVAAGVPAGRRPSAVQLHAMQTANINFSWSPSSRNDRIQQRGTGTR